MARKFNKSSTRSKRTRRPLKGKSRGRRRLSTGNIAGFGSAALTLKEMFEAGKIGYDVYSSIRDRFPKGRPLNRISKVIKRIARMRSRQLSAPKAANIQQSGGLVVGSFKKLSLSQRMMSIEYPPTHYNMKWTFIMDAVGGRVSACSIPIMTQTLAQPLYTQLFANLTSDVTANPVDPLMNPSGSEGARQYEVMINSYKSNLRFYNSSSNTMRCRIVWYKPRINMEGAYTNHGAHSSAPINMLMLASNIARPTTAYFNAVGQGLNFDATTAGSNYDANYHHCGAELDPFTGLTTGSSPASVVAHLDPSLVPGSPQVKKFFNSFWTTLKSEDFELTPGNQFNTSVTLRNRVMKGGLQEDVLYRTDSTIVGVVYVLGQMVFDQSIANKTISTGSGQLSVMREDTCSIRPMIVRREKRVNLSAPYVIIDKSVQAIIDTTTGDTDDVYDENT